MVARTRPSRVSGAGRRLARAAIGHPTGVGESEAEAPRHVVVDGRKWRASDPVIPAPLRSELVHELMDARRAVAAGTRDGDEAAVASARRRVRHAKVALGERGAPWWEPVSEADRRTRLESAVLALLARRDETSTICPSDAARIAGGTGWRAELDLARRVAFALQDEGVVEVRSAGIRVAGPEGARGPLRIARGPAWPASSG